MLIFKKYGFITLALVLSACVLAGCPAGKDAARDTNAGVAPGKKIDVTPAPAQQAPVAPPVAPPAQNLAVSEFTVTGMDCADCSASIEAKLIKLPGVTTVSADFKAGTAKVQYDPAKCKPTEMVKAIESLGFKATEKQTGTSKLPGADNPQPAEDKTSSGEGATPGAGA
jgi:copper chaperone CopZ